MKLLISMNHKFFEFSPKEIVDMSKEDSSALGFEIFIDINKENEIKYLKDLAFECKRNNLVLNMHGEVYDDMNLNYKYLDLINDISNILLKTVNVVYHSIYIDSKESSVSYTKNFFNKVLKYIEEKEYNITLSLENLNDIENQDRLNKDDIIPILTGFPELKFTFDIGHELIDYGNVTYLSDLQISRLNNVHLHSFSCGNDHQELTDTDIHKNDRVKAITYLKLINYDGNVVLEYDLYSLRGKDTKEKLYSYIKSINKINEYFYKQH